MFGYPLILNISGLYKRIASIMLDDATSSIKNCDVLFFCHDASRGIALNGQAYSPLIDSLREDFEERGLVCLTVALPWARLTGRRGFGAPISINRSFFFALTAHRIRRLWFSMRGKKCHSRSPLLSLFNNILAKASPRLVVTIGSPVHLCESARIMCIFHVELLHAMGYWGRIPGGWGSQNIRHLPQGFLSLDPVSSETFLPLAAKGVAIKSIPHPFLKRFVSGNLMKTPAEWRTGIEINPRYRKVILVSLQWGYAGDHDKFCELSGILENGLFYEEITRVVQKTKSWIYWRFRFHPVQITNRTKYRHLFAFMEDFVLKNQNCEWKVSSTLPLPSIASQCHGNITMSSSSCYDLAYFGVPSLVLCPTVRPGGFLPGLFSDIEASGYIKKGYPTERDIYDWVENAHTLPPMPGSLTDNAMWGETVKWLLGQKDLSMRQVST